MTSEATRTAGDIRIGGQRVLLTPHNCFACGTLNVHGLQLRLHAGNDLCWAELTLPDRFEGWEGIAHGGIVCTILDEVMAWALVGDDDWGVTARISVDFKRPVPLGIPLRAEGWTTRTRRRIVDTEASIVDGSTGAELATATGVYVVADAARKRQLQRRYGFRRLDPSPNETGR